MLDHIISDFISQSFSHELTNADWLNYSTAFALEADQQKCDVFIKTVATHSGVLESQIRLAFETLKDISKPQEERDAVLASLQHEQSQATAKILSFKQRDFFKELNMEVFSMSRSHWNLLITRFEQQKRIHLTHDFFLINFSAIREISISHLLMALSEPQPHRAVKQVPIDEEHSASKRARFFKYVEDQGANPLIYERKTHNPDLEAALAQAGVRMVDSLIPASPVKGYPSVKGTPGGRKVREVCDIDGRALHKHLTPLKSQEHYGRVALEAPLPKLTFGRAEPVEYVAKLEPILQRSGMKRRYSALTLMGASAADAFRAHKVDIQPKDSRSHHWAHLIAHFLADAEDVVSEDKSVTEAQILVPATAAANYNTLEAIELFIRQKLVDKKTNEIHIHVAPKYSGDNLIPDVLIYNLSWHEGQLECKETFNICPQSHLRLTKSMHQSIDILRKEREKMEPLPLFNP